MDKLEEQIEKSTKNYKAAVEKVYDEKLTNTVNLINGCIEEEKCEFNERLMSIVNEITFVPRNYAKSINSVLNTTYTNEDFDRVIKDYVEKAVLEVVKYINETMAAKRRQTKAEEVRKELDEAKALVEALKGKKEPEPVEVKLTFWQKVKKFFSRKK